MKPLIKPLIFLSTVLAFAVGANLVFSAPCPILLSEIKTGATYGIILKDTASRGLTGTISEVDTKRCMVTIHYAAEKFAIVDGNYIIVILENP